MIIIVYKEKVLKEEQVRLMYDPLSKNTGVGFVVSQKYAELFALPFLPVTRKKVVAYGLATNEPIPIQLWTPEIKNHADDLRKITKGTWKLFMFWYVLVILIAGAFIYTRTKKHFKGKDEDIQAEFFANPKVNDIVYAKTFAETVEVSPFKIVAEKGDTLFVLASDESKPTGTVFLDPSKAVGMFDVSDSKFKGDTLIFQKKSYSGRHLMKFPPIKKSTNELSGTRDNLIEIIYIERPS